ncbi:DUF3592 domain-containing protein [Kitasatospora sp. NPDC056327]|uniref:DUF3592 domain-containing protein n=1 Tax=Kitasatospora sp. NPDC056327 TaxID=3345785 RepID=UPI0035E0B559
MTAARRVGGGRRFFAVVFGLFAVAGGWCVATGHLRSFGAGGCVPGTDCQADVTSLLLALGVALCLLALFGALALAENRDVEQPQRLPLAMTSPAAALLGLLGAAAADGAPRSGLLLAAAVSALLALVGGVRGERRIRRENAEQKRRRDLAARLHSSGATVVGTVTEVRQPGRPGSGSPAARRLRLTVRYAGPDGRAYTLVHTGTFPSYALPGVGGRLALRHDPRDPSVAVVAAAGTAPAPALSEELERLAALHRDGVLDTAEFTAAKARLIGTAAGR